MTHKTLRAIAVAIALGGTAIAAAGCSPQQQAKFDEDVAKVKAKILADLKALSARFLRDATALAAKVPNGLADAPLARIRQNDKDIQDATELGPVLRVYARAAGTAADDLLKVAELVPGAAPYVEAVRTAARILHGFADSGKIAAP